MELKQFYEQPSLTGKFNTQILGKPEDTTIQHQTEGGENARRKNSCENRGVGAVRIFRKGPRKEISKNKDDNSKELENIRRDIMKGI